MNRPRFNHNWTDLARKFGYSDEKDMLEQMYSVQGLSVSEISIRLGCTTTAVMKHLQKANIETRARGGANASARQTCNLFHLDQRVVLLYNLEKLSKEVSVSRALCYKYRTSQTIRREPWSFVSSAPSPGLSDMQL